MKIRLLENCEFGECGDIVELSLEIAEMYIVAGIAEPALLKE